MDKQDRDYIGKVPQLQVERYFLWKTRMISLIGSLGPRMLQTLETGPFHPIKTIAAVTEEDDKITPEITVPKLRSEFSPEEEAEVNLDRKVRYILFQGLSDELLKTVINCESAKEIWETLQILCEGTEEVRENNKGMLIQQYEYFMALPRETLTETYNRLKQLVNNLRLHNKYYENKEINIKFLQAMPKQYDVKTHAMRHSPDWKNQTLDTLYGSLRTLDLENAQRDKMQTQHMDRSVALLTREQWLEEQNFSQAANSTTAHKQGQTAAYVTKEIAADDDESTNNYDEDLAAEELGDEVNAFIIRKFKKLRFTRKKPAAMGSAAKYSPQNPTMDKSSVRCYNCNGIGHFANECRKPKMEKNSQNSKDPDYYKKKYFELLNKEKSKGKALLTEGRDWADSEDEEQVNLALMANGDQEATRKSITKVTDFSISSYRTFQHSF